MEQLIVSENRHLWVVLHDHVPNLTRVAVGKAGGGSGQDERIVQEVMKIDQRDRVLVFVARVRIHAAFSLVNDQEAVSGWRDGDVPNRSNQWPRFQGFVGIRLSQVPRGVVGDVGCCGEQYRFLRIGCKGDRAKKFRLRQINDFGT